MLQWLVKGSLTFDARLWTVLDKDWRCERETIVYADIVSHFNAAGCDGWNPVSVTE